MSALVFGGSATEDSPDTASSSMGSCFSVVDGCGVSTNIIEGPAASSVEIAVRGVGLEVNFGSDEGRTGDGGTKDFAERCEEELATLRAFDEDALVVRMAVSDAAAFGCGRRGFTDCAPGISSLLSLRGGFQIALRRSSWREKKELLGAVFRRLG